MSSRIPPEVAGGVAAMLARYVPGLTGRRVVEAFAAIESSDGPGRPLAEALTKAECCRAAKVSLPTLNRMLKDGRLPSRKLGRCVRIPRQALEELLSVDSRSMN